MTPTSVPFSPLRLPYQRWAAHMDFLDESDTTRVPKVTPTQAQQVAREKFGAMTADEVEQDIRTRAAIIRKDRKGSRVVTPGAAQAMRKMLTEELGMRRIRYATVVTLHRILARLESVPDALISQYDETLGDEKTIRTLQQTLARAGYLTQAPKFYGNGKATLQAFKGTGKPRHRPKLIPSENYWDGLGEFNGYSQLASMGADSLWQSHITEADVPY